MTDNTEEPKVTVGDLNKKAVASRLADMAEHQMVGIGHEPGTSAMALLAACQIALYRHGNKLEIAATLMEMAFGSCGMEVNGKHLCKRLATGTNPPWSSP